MAGEGRVGRDGGSATGGAIPVNNMVVVQRREYDCGAVSGGNGLLTKVTAHVSNWQTRETEFEYNYRNARIRTAGELGFREEYTLDVQNRVVLTERWNDDGTSLLTAMGGILGMHSGQVPGKVAIQ